jgi:hypothetical protein
MGGKREALRPDTTLAPAKRPEDEVYVRGLPACCLRSLKETVVQRGERRFLELHCLLCGSAWQVTSSLDERVLERFVTHGGPRAGGKHPAA